jgi:hypothetical protein
MSAEQIRSALWIGLLAGSAGLVQAQTLAEGRAQVIVSSGGLLAEGSSIQPQGQIYREIDDPHTGDRWLLLRNEEFPGGPGRLVRVAASGHVAGGAPGQSVGQPVAAVTPVLPVIRSGDRVIVEEHTDVADARLEARALKPAAVGTVFEARLMIGGRVVRVVALGPGRAVFEPEARP